MPRPRGARFAMALILMAPVAVSAQARTCDLVQPATYRQIVNARGEEVIYFRDPVRLRCTGAVQVEADSAVYNRPAALLELVGQVVYRDSTRMLTSDWANYLGRQEQVLARGNVVLTDLVDGSVVRGGALNYLRATPTRPTSRVLVEGGRPHAVLRDRAPGEAADTARPLEVLARQMEILGEARFLARGEVELERGSMTGAADSARFEQVQESVSLFGRAWVRDEGYRLEGDRIDALLEGEGLREVVAHGRARLESEELAVEAIRLRIGFVAGALERLEAWMPGEPADGRRALAIAEDFRLRADSIDARADSGGIREVRAVRRAFGERRLSDGDASSIAAHDWIQGDTITGYFAEVPADPDTTGNALERVVVIGATEPALSLYRVEPDEPGGRQPINFMKARRIVLFLAEGVVIRVEAEGALEGLYLEPVAPPAARPEAARVGRGRP